MVTKKCPFCAEEIRAEAVKCRFCKGLLNKTETQKRQNQTVITVMGLIMFAPFVVCTLICAGLLISTSDDQNDSSSMFETYASVVSKEFVKVRLAYPNDAKFPWSSDNVEHLGSNRYQVESHVVVQNAFGAKFRKNYTCVVKYTGGDESYTSSWQLESLSALLPTGILTMLANCLSQSPSPKPRARR